MRSIVVAFAMMGPGVLAVQSPGSAQAAHASTTVAEPQDFWTGPVNDPVPATLKGGTVIHTRALAALIKDQSHSPVIVDVSNAPRRPENLPATTQWLPLPHPGIPGAIWIPGAGLGEPPPALDEFYRTRLAAATGNDLSRRVVIYCHARCWLSWNAAKRAIRYGYRQVYWFPDGIEGWRHAKLPTAVIEPESTP